MPTDALPSAEQVDSSDTGAAFTSSGSDSQIDSFTVPAASFNALTGITEDDILGVRVRREGANAADTYNADWRVLGVLITFT